MTNPKIAYIIPYFHPFKGGAEQNILAMAGRMAHKGYDVTVLTTMSSYRDEAPAKYEEYRGIKIHRLKAFIRRPLYLIFIPGLLRKLLKEDYDVIHVSGFGFLWIEICLSIKKIFSKKTIFINTPHGPFMANENESGFRKLAKNIYTFYLKFLVPWLYKRVIAVVPKQSEWMKSDYHIKDENIVVVPNGIEITYLEEKLFEHDKKDKVIISYLNRMEWYKGIQTVLYAITKLRKSKSFEELPKFEFYIMGRPAGYTEKLKEIVAKEELGELVKFIYSPSDEERDRIFYQESQINILPSKWEATGIALIEAMAKGNVPVTTFQNQAHELLINDGESGFVFDFGDNDKLAEILKKLLVDFDLRQSMRQKNMEIAKNFTWEAVFPKYEELILDLVNA